MVLRSWAVVLALLSAFPAAAQPRTDILTGEPVRPAVGSAHSQPEITNAPHAPRQDPDRSGSNPPLDMYVTPGSGTELGHRNGAGAMLERRPVTAPRRWQQPP